jgi:5-methylcytosine-specific restriction endonuclease McrA
MQPPDHPPSRDHIHARSRGGLATEGNRLIVCVPCNWDKGAWSLAAFAAALEAEGDPRAQRVLDLIGQKGQTL